MRTKIVVGFGIVSIARLVTRDLEFHGAPLRAGDMILLPTVLHGLDERENPDPMRVDFARGNARPSTFGPGAHHCVGTPSKPHGYWYILFQDRGADVRGRLDNDRVDPVTGR